MNIQLDMSPEAAALVRKMYENGELDDIVASMVRVDEPEDEATEGWVSPNEPTRSESAAESIANVEGMKAARARYKALVEEASRSAFSPGTIHYGELGNTSKYRTNITLSFRGETITVFFYGDTTHRKQGDKVKVEMIETTSISPIDELFPKQLSVKLLDD